MEEVLLNPRATQVGENSSHAQAGQSVLSRQGQLPSDLQDELRIEPEMPTVLSPQIQGAPVAR